MRSYTEGGKGRKIIRITNLIQKGGRLRTETTSQKGTISECLARGGCARYRIRPSGSDPRMLGLGAECCKRVCVKERTSRRKTWLRNTLTRHVKRSKKRKKTHARLHAHPTVPRGYAVDVMRCVRAGNVASTNQTATKRQCHKQRAKERSLRITEQICGKREGCGTANRL